MLGDGSIKISGSVYIHGKYYKAAWIDAPPPLVWLPLTKHNKSRFNSILCRMYYIWTDTGRSDDLTCGIMQRKLMGVENNPRPRGAELEVGALI